MYFSPSSFAYPILTIIILRAYLQVSSCRLKNFLLMKSWTLCRKRNFSLFHENCFLHSQFQFDSFRFQKGAESIFGVFFNVRVAGEWILAPFKPLQCGDIFRKVDGTMLQLNTDLEQIDFYAIFFLSTHVNGGKCCKDRKIGNCWPLARHPLTLLQKRFQSVEFLVHYRQDFLRWLETRFVEAKWNLQKEQKKKFNVNKKHWFCFCIKCLKEKNSETK